MTTGSLLFMLGSWVFVLSLLIWSFTKIFAAQDRRAHTPDPGDDMTASERVPPTA
ncbi:MAG TPA: hypothetical protein VD948_04580 [Rhodothermales bacterium]|nr:hypothetical protein [Rhodothermales bacterium]